MSISEPFIRRPIGTSLLAIGLFLTGMTAYRCLPVASVPRVDYPVVSVSASLPGADPSTVGFLAGGAAGKAPGPDRRRQPNDLRQHAGRMQHHAAI